jgi:hypothetical protein
MVAGRLHPFERLPADSAGLFVSTGILVMGFPERRLGLIGRTGMATNAPVVACTWLIAPSLASDLAAPTDGDLPDLSQSHATNETTTLASMSPCRVPNRRSR